MGHTLARAFAQVRTFRVNSYPSQQRHWLTPSSDAIQRRLSPYFRDSGQAPGHRKTLWKVSTENDHVSATYDYKMPFVM